MTTYPIAKSTLAPSGLVNHLLPRYGLGEIASCILFSPGINDTYQVETTRGERYFLRVYRAPWRSMEDVGYEVDALNHLHKKGIPVAYPITACDGTQIQTVEAPEGERCVVLFSYAPGAEPSYDEDGPQKARVYGRAVARLHNALDDFHSPHRRFQIDLDHLICDPVRRAGPFLADRPADWEYLQWFAGELLRQIDALPGTELEWGFCHGDLQGYHHHIAADGTLTFFDFDCCGYGIRAYDLGIFLWLSEPDNTGAWWHPYLEGYQEERPLADIDLRAVPVFTCARYLWHIGLHTQNAPDWGYGWLDNAYFDKAIRNLRRCEERHFR